MAIVVTTLNGNSRCRNTAAVFACVPYRRLPVTHFTLLSLTFCMRARVGVHCQMCETRDFPRSLFIFRLEADLAPRSPMRLLVGRVSFAVECASERDHA